MAEIKLILLDFDGTLVDTRNANAEAYIEALGEVGIHLTKEEYLEHYFGEMDAKELKSLYAKCEVGDGYCYQIEEDELKKLKFLKAQG